MENSVVSRCRAFAWVIGLAVLGCDTFADDRRHDEFILSPNPSVGVAPVPPRDAPTDERPAVFAAKPPPPVTGGTLLATADGKAAVVADPDRDRITFVDLERMAVTGTVELSRGDMPGRLVEAANGRIFGVLRGAGSVITLDRSSSTIVESRSVCAAPRGIAYDSSADRLLVACAEGLLVELPPSGAVTRTVSLPDDLRDVVVTPKSITVSRFRIAHLIELDHDLNVVVTRQPPVVENVLRGFSSETTRFEPAVAWRTVAASDGSIFVVHQRATSAAIDLAPPNDGVSSAYGGGVDTCGGIVQTGITRVTSTGLVGSTPQLAGLVLPVDVAVSPTRDYVAVAIAGPLDPNAPNQHSVLLKESLPGTTFEAMPAVAILHPQMVGTTPDGCGGAIVLGTEPTTSVAVNPVSGELLAQLREPAQLVVITEPRGIGTLARIPLGDPAREEEDSRYDTGHELFHRAAGVGLACASCHPEGTDDGRVWNFAGMGPRRTQYLRVGLGDTAPFHWDGTLADVSALTEDVMVGRMGGARQTLERNDALAQWMFALPAEPPRAADPDAIARGKVLFDEVAGCVACHSGPQFTNNQTVDVGTGGPLQVPSLVGIGWHAPFMHDGCAKTLAERFNPACGGTAHGDTAGLSSEQIADLVAYLESL